MLYTLIFLFSISAFADVSDALMECATNVLMSRGGQSYSAIQTKKIAYGDTLIKKEFKQELEKAVPGKYDKHIKARTDEEAKSISMLSKDVKKKTNGTNLEQAQFLPVIAKKREKIERHALVHMKGFWKPHNKTVYKYVKFDDVIGYSAGEPTKWLRVELSSGVYHGHPVDAKRLKDLCPECQ